MRVLTSGFGSPYSAIMTLLWLNPSTVYLTGLKGGITRASYAEFYRELKKLKVTTILRHRHGELEIRELK